MGSNPQYSVGKRGDGTITTRGDGAFSYANRLIAEASIVGTDYTVIFLWDRGNSILYGVPIGGGTPVVLVADFQPSQIKADYVNRIFFWTNDTGGNGTYGGANVIYGVKYALGTGIFVDTPTLIFPNSDSNLDAIWPDKPNNILYFEHGGQLKRGEYASARGAVSLVQIELMNAPDTNVKDIWRGTSGLLYFADDSTGGIDTHDVVRTGTPPQYAEVVGYYDNSEDYDWIEIDEVGDHMFISGNGITPLRVMTWTNPVDMTTFHTKSSAIYEPFAIDAINGHIYISESVSSKLNRYEYRTRSKVNQTEIVDYSAEGIGSLFGRIALG